MSCLAFLYSETVRAQYRRRWGSGVGNPTVRLNDLAFTVCGGEREKPIKGKGKRAGNELIPRESSRHMRCSGRVSPSHSSIGGDTPGCHLSGCLGG